MSSSFKLRGFAVSWLSIFFSLTSAEGTTTFGTGQVCRFLPEDEGWPSTQEWNTLNTTIGGRLIATVPLASVCHGATFNETECAALQAVWDFPQAQ